ncbi:hypothetical protein GCM10011383_40160 [Hymenobacter cavernae]|uniref:Uncharacterized protein n=1 Tax=Hymenobacter cavernae TaxID=2044852 RepID=A0ABQ1USZ3_9BACT|nr:hypothetical protein GCM10011383_40160 [Hymenobacter cavernae]
MYSDIEAMQGFHGAGFGVFLLSGQNDLGFGRGHFSKENGLVTNQISEGKAPGTTAIGVKQQG